MVKNRLVTRVLSVVLFWVAGLALSSCGSDDGGASDIPDNVCYDFVTFVSTGDRGTIFTFQRGGDTDLITLTAAVKIDTNKIEPGSRVIIQYLPSGGQSVYQSGAIKLFGIIPILNESIETESQETIESWGHNPVKVRVLARSGKYLDVWVEAVFGKAPQRFVLAADEATLGDEYPDLYLIFVTDDDMGRVHQTYASFDLSEVWDLETSKGAKLTYYTDDGAETMTLRKQ